MSSSLIEDEESQYKYIIKGVIDIKKEDENKKIRIINSYDNCIRERKQKGKDVEMLHNEKEIKDNIQIKIDGKN